MMDDTRRYSKFTLPTALLLAAVQILYSAPLAYAGGTVTDCANFGPGPGTLQDALVGGGFVNFACSSTIVVPEITVDLDTTIDGSGQNVTLSGGDQNRVIWVNPDTRLSLNKLTISDGAIGSPTLFGGGIFNNGELTVTDSSISDNSATSAGGIWNADGASLMLIRSTISNNVVSSFGGGMFNVTTSVVTIENSTISGNVAGITGGIVARGASLTITNSTISQNEAQFNGASGIDFDLTGSVRLEGSIIAGNLGRPDCLGTAITDLGHNLDGDGSCNLTASTSLSNTNPLLGPLAGNGGPTDTHALLPGSPAVDRGGDCDLNIDQRGLPRPRGPACDIGSYEQDPPKAIPTLSEWGLIFLAILLTGLGVGTIRSRSLGPPVA